MKISILEPRKIFIAFLLSGFLFLNTSFAAKSYENLFQEGVEQYRNGNAAECLGIMKMLNKQDPSNSYVLYYLAMSNAKSGNVDEAKRNYEQVILLGQDSQLVTYAKQGIENIENVDNSSAAREEKEGTSPFKKIFNKSDAPPAKEAKTDDVKKSVTDDEVANAIKVLRNAGLLNVQVGAGAGSGVSPLMSQSSELMNLNMMMGSMGGGKNSGMDMLPFLMMQQQGQNGNSSASNISPEVIQMMMSNTMLDGLSTFDTNDKDK